MDSVLSKIIMLVRFPLIVGVVMIHYTNVPIDGIDFYILVLLNLLKQ